jgi:hypothetical protein
MTGATVVFVLCVGVLSGPLDQRDPLHPVGLNPRIGPAVPQKYRAIRDSRDWKNPILIVGRDGVELRTMSVVPGTNIVTIADLRQSLIDLPLSAWPYGRVVALQTGGILAGEPGETEALATNREAALAILKSLRVKVEQWPA